MFSFDVAVNEPDKRQASALLISPDKMLSRRLLLLAACCFVYVASETGVSVHYILHCGHQYHFNYNIKIKEVNGRKSTPVFLPCQIESKIWAAVL